MSGSSNGKPARSLGVESRMLQTTSYGGSSVRTGRSGRLYQRPATISLLPYQMIIVEIPGRPKLTIEHLVLDVNGTIAQDGQLVRGVIDRVQRLRKILEIHLLTADTHGRRREIDQALDVTGIRLTPGEGEAQQKARYVDNLGADHVIAIGNGANDALMLEAAAIGIVVLGSEGTSAEALCTADIVATTPLVALDLLLNPKRLVATLRR